MTMTMTILLPRRAAGTIKPTERERPGADLAVEATAEVAPEIVKMAAAVVEVVGGIGDRLGRNLAHQGLARRRGVERGAPLAQGVGQEIARDHHAGKGGNREGPVPGAGPSLVPVPETETVIVIVIVTGIKVAGGGRGAGHMTGHVIAGRDPVRDHHMREGGATVLARGHVIMTVNDEQPTSSADVCVSACHITRSLHSCYPLALWSGNRLTVPTRLLG